VRGGVDTRRDSQRSAASDALTSLSHGAGCGCKLQAAALLPIARELGAAADERLLVGSDTVDDAAVYRVSDDLALVQTVDFFTPIVDDPYDFGRIAAANALSDIYAMGATPVLALNIVAFPLERLGAEVLGEILRGGRDVVIAAGAAVAGGHSIDDSEPKYGLSVTGTVHPDQVLTNAGAVPGDVLVLTNPLARRRARAPQPRAARRRSPAPARAERGQGCGPDRPRHVCARRHDRRGARAGHRHHRRRGRHHASSAARRATHLTQVRLRPPRALGCRSRHPPLSRRQRRATARFVMLIIGASAIAHESAATTRMRMSQSTGRWVSLLGRLL
jgi:hypothetical protein